MSGILMQLLLFSAKAIIIMLFILIVFAGILSLLGRGKERLGGKITIKNLLRTTVFNWTDETRPTGFQLLRS